LSATDRYYENFDISVTPKVLEVLEPLYRAAAEDEFDEQVARELTELANECRARLQQIAAGNRQTRNKN
jgi:hypothetical protein